MMEKIEIELKIDIYRFICEIREKRQTLVQTLSQYIFIHDALCEYCLYKFTDISAPKIKEVIKINLNMPTEKKAIDHNYVMKFWKKRNNSKLKSIAEIEFEKISNRYKSYELMETDTKYYYSIANNIATLSIYYLLPDYKQKFYDAYNAENKPKNRNQNAVCYDFNRVKIVPYETIMTDKRKNSKNSQRQSLNYNYINATKLKYLNNLDKDFIITQDPLKHTIVDFFTMISQSETRIIVSLNCDFEPVI